MVLEFESVVGHGGVVAMEMVSEMILILDCSISFAPKLVFVNKSLCNHMGTKLLSVLSWEYTDVKANGNAKRGVTERQGTISLCPTTVATQRREVFSFRAVSYGCSFQLCILKVLNNAEMLWLFFKDTQVMMGVIEADFEANTWYNILANEMTLAYTHCTPEQMHFRSAQEKGYPPALIDLHMEKMRLCFETKKPAFFDYLLPDYGGGSNTINVHCCFSLLGEKSARGLPLIGYVFQDTTEIRQIEADLHEQAKRTLEFRQFFALAPMNMALVEVLEEEGDAFSVLSNQGHAAGYKMTPEQLVGLRFRRDLHVPDETMDFFMEKYKVAYAIKKPLKCDVALLKADGVLYRYEIIISYIGRNEDSGNKRYAAIMVDQTKSKNTEAELERHKDHLEDLVALRTEELLRSEQKFRSLVNSAPNVILTVDKSGTVQYANRPISDHTVTLGMNLWDLFVDSSQIKSGLACVLSDDTTAKFEVKLNEEGEKWFSLSVGRINEDLGIVVATDITESKILSERLHKAMHAKGRFLANMSHEVRTPLSGIIGSSRFLVTSDLDSDQRECVDTIIQCGEVLLTVINDILSFSKIEAVGLELYVQEMSLVQCFEDSLYIVLPVAQEKGLELILDVEPSIPDVVEGDCIRLKQILVNLLNNAVKFTDSGYILVSVNGKPIPDSTSWEFCVCVKDTGIGIPPGSEAKLFQMFSQLDVSTTRKYGGTGIGLLFARRLIESMCGKIWVESTGVNGQGSSFFFTIVLACPHHATPSVTFLLQSPLLQCFPPHFVVPTIVIADRFEATRNALTKQLLNMGFVKVVTLGLASEIGNFFRNLDHQVIFFCEVEFRTNEIENFLKEPNVTLITMGPSQPASVKTTSPTNFLRKPIKSNKLATSMVTALKSIMRPPPLPALSLSHHSPVAPSSPRGMGGRGRCAIEHAHTVMLEENGIEEKNLHVLVVEDNLMNQKVIRRIFTTLGYQVVLAVNGKDALDCIASRFPDFIVMDVQMPVMDGVTCTKKIREMYGCSWPYIVTVTADVFPEDEKRCREAGTTDFLTKPLDIEKLKKCLHKCAVQKRLLGC